MAIVSPDVFDQIMPEDISVEATAISILRRQFQTYRATSQRRDVQLALGRLFLAEGRLSKAALHLTEAADLAQSKAHQVEAHLQLGTVLQRQGRLLEAQQALEEALPFAAEDIAPLVLQVLGEVKLELGDAKEALHLHRLAWEQAERQGDADRGALLAATIGEDLASLGRLQDGLSWLDTALQLLEVSRASPAGAEEAIQAKVRSTLGLLQHRLGRVRAASESFRQALRIQSRQLAAGHPDLVSTRLGLARTRRDGGDTAGALREVEVLELALREGTQEGPELSRVLLFKSDIVRETGDLEAARAAIREARELQEALVLGADHPEVGLALSSQASILHDLGALEQAHEKYRESLEISLRLLGDQHPRTAAAYNSLGTLHQDLGDHEAARGLFEACLAIQVATVGRESPEAASTYNNLATVHFRQGRPGEASRLLGLALVSLDRAGVPQDNPDRLLYQENLDLVRARVNGS